MRRPCLALVAVGTAGVLAAGPVGEASAVEGPLDRLERAVQSAPGRGVVPAGDVAVRPQGRAVAASTLPPQVTYSVLSVLAENFSSAVVRIDPRDGRARTLAAAGEADPFLQVEAWSAAARRVFYTALRERSPSSVDSVPQQGGPPAREVTADEGGFDISRDGRRIVFAREEGQTTNLFIADRGGANARRLTGAGGSAPRFSQDGRRIVFSRDLRVGDDVQSDLFTIGADGRGLTRVTGRADADDVFAAFSPDGRRLLFTRLVLTEDDVTLGVFSVGVDGRGLRLVRDDAYAPDWAANGWLTYIGLGGADGRSQVLVRAPGLASRDRELVRENNFVGGARFAR